MTTLVVLCPIDHEKKADLPDMLLACGVAFENEVYCHNPKSMVDVCSGFEGSFVVVTTDSRPEVNRALLKESETTYRYKGLWELDDVILKRKWEISEEKKEESKMCISIKQKVHGGLQCLCIVDSEGTVLYAQCPPVHNDQFTNELKQWVQKGYILV